MKLLRGVLGLAWLAFAATGCVKHARIACPSDGGRPWREVRSPHFRVLTDLSEPAARDATRKLELYRSALLLTWDGARETPGSVDAILLNNRGELEEFQGENFAGFWATGLDGPLMVINGHSYALFDATGDVSVVAHEMAHDLSRRVLLRQPLWVAEGLAQYLETVRFERGTDRVILGEAPEGSLELVRAQPRWLSLDTLWKWTNALEQNRRDRSEHYFSAWLWTYYLVNAQPERFTDFQQRLARAEEPRLAWEAAFQGAPDLDQGLRDFLRSHRSVTVTRSLPPVVSAMEVRELSAGQAHLIRARLGMLGVAGSTPPQRQQFVLRELAQALKEDPNNADALLLEAYLGGAPERLTRARALVAKYPTEGRAWKLLGRALRDAKAPPEELEATWSRAVELLPDDEVVLNELAWHHFEQGHPEKGLALAQHAVRIAPGSPGILDTYAALLFQLGRCEEALPLQRRAVEMLPERAPPESTKGLHERLARFEQSCGAAARR